MHLTADELHRRGTEFARLHDGPDPFVLPNPWDAGSAKLLAGLGFSALATTSAGFAFTLGRRDGDIDLADTLDNARAIVAATDLPVSADLEDGYAEDADGVAETIRRAAEAGLVGGSIEDSTGRPADPIRPLETAVERVTAAVEAAKGLPFPFTVTARAENFLWGRPDLDDTIGRLQAYQEAGADVLYAPGLPDLDAIRTVCAAVDRPVNVVVLGRWFPVADLADCGVRRISLGSALARDALGSLTRAAREILDQGTFSFSEKAMPYAEANGVMGAGAG